MATSANAAYKTLIQYGDGATPELFTTVAEVREIDPPEQTAPEIDATSHDSSAAEYILSSCEDSGEFTIAANFLGDATATAVRGDLGAAARNWQLCFPNFGARTLTFTANAGDDKLTATAHGLTTGQPVQVSTSASDLPEPLVANTTYYAIYDAANTLLLATTNANAVAGTQIDITDTGTGTHTLQIGNRLSMAALVKGHKLDSPREDALAVNYTVRVTDAITIT